VADSFAIDRHYVNNPNELYDQQLDDVLVDLDNKIVLEGKLIVIILLLAISDYLKFICSVRRMRCHCHWMTRKFLALGFKISAKPSL
jgi:hypothetical protein